MKRYQTSILFTVAVMSAFWAYVISTSLVRDFFIPVTSADLATIFILGGITGAALGWIAAARQR